jgi:hypothetical protein
MLARAALSQAPAESQVSKRNTRIKRRKIRMDCWGYFDGRIPGYGDVARVPRWIYIYEYQYDGGGVESGQSRCLSVYLAIKKIVGHP